MRKRVALLEGDELEVFENSHPTGCVQGVLGHGDEANIWDGNEKG